MKNKEIVLFLAAAGVGYWAYNKYLKPLPPANIVIGDSTSVASLPVTGAVAMAGIKSGSMN